MSRRADQRGASAIEMAIVAPAFLLLIFAIIEIALWMHARDVAQAAAREGVSELRTTEPGAEQDRFLPAIESAAVASARDLGDIIDPQAESTYDADGGTVTVTVTGGVIDLIPGWDLKVSGSASGLIETFRPDHGDEQVP